MKKTVFYHLVFLCCIMVIAAPLRAQNKLLPAAKATLGATAGQTAVGRQTAKAALSKAAGSRAVRQAASGAVQKTPTLRPTAKVRAQAQKVSANARQNASAAQSNFARRLDQAAAGISYNAKSQQPKPAKQTAPKQIGIPFTKEDKNLLLQLRWSLLTRAAQARLRAPNEQVKQKFESTLQQISRLAAENERWVKELFFEPSLIRQYSPFAQKNNELVKVSLANHIKRVKWLDAYPQQGRGAFQTVASKQAVSDLAQRLQNEKMIILGECHYFDEIQQSVVQLVTRLKEQNPQRRVVLFTEFINLPRAELPMGYTTDTYFRRVTGEEVPAVDLPRVKVEEYAQKTFAQLLNRQIEVYPLEDYTQCQLLEAETLGHMNALLAVVHRNKMWARVIAAKMAEIRKTDPDALFLVYAGNGHTSWVKPYSIPKFFANENPVVVEIGVRSPARSNNLRVVWGKNDPFFNAHHTDTFSFWTGPDARALAQHSGFDYSLVLAEKPWPKLKRIYNVFFR